MFEQEATEITETAEITEITQTAEIPCDPQYFLDKAFAKACMSPGLMYYGLLVRSPRSLHRVTECYGFSECCLWCGVPRVGTSFRRTRKSAGTAVSLRELVLRTSSP